MLYSVRNMTFLMECHKLDTKEHNKVTLTHSNFTKDDLLEQLQKLVNLKEWNL